MKIKQFLPPVFVFLSVFVVFALYQFLWIGASQLAGNDSYTHLAKTNIFITEGFEEAKYEHMLPYTAWTDLHTDNTLVYDLLIAPLTYFPNQIIAAKLFTCLLAGVIASVFFTVSVRISKRSKLSLAATLLLFANYAFFLKFTELRSLVFSILFFFLTAAVVLYGRRRYYLLSPIAFFYTLLHTSAFLMLLPLVVVLLADLKQFKHNLLMFAYSILGMLAAVLIFPAPNFLQIFVLQPVIPLFYLRSAFEIEGAYEVKGEIRTPLNFLITNLFSTFVLLSLLAAIIRNRYFRKLTPGQSASILLFVILVTLTFISRRFSEYISPAALLMVSINAEFISRQFIKLKGILQKNAKIKLAFVLLVLISLPVFAFVFYTKFIRDNLERADLGQGLPDSYNAAVFANTRLPEGALLFNHDWTDFPFFAYYAPVHKYAAGMELGFMYLHNPYMLRFYQDFRSYRNLEIRDGELIYTLNNLNAFHLIQSEFGSNYLLMRKGKSEKTTALLLQNYQEFGLEKEFEDENYVIFNIQ